MGGGMDNKDDFEFKPLSQGLGFHARQKNGGTASLNELEIAPKNPTKNNLNLSLAEAFTETKSEAQINVSSIEKSSVTITEPKSKNKTKTKLESSTVYTIDESLTLDQMPQFKTPITTETPFIEKKVETNKGAMEIAFGRSFEKQTETPKEKKTSQHQISLSSQTAKQAVDDILKTLKEKKGSTETPAAQKQQIQQAKKSPTATQIQNQITDPVKQKLMQGYRPALMSWGAAFLDGLLIFAASLLCMIILLAVTRVDLLKTLSQSTDKEIYFALFGLFALVNFLYMTVHRVFLGQTPGEWAFDQRLGDLNEQFEISYIFKTSARTLLMIATGIITIPVLSALIGRDLLADVLGLQLYEKKI